MSSLEQLILKNVEEYLVLFSDDSLPPKYAQF